MNLDESGSDLDESESDLDESGLAGAGSPKRTLRKPTLPMFPMGYVNLSF